MDLNLNDFDLLPVTSVNNISVKTAETLYDITVEGDHTFFVKLPNTDEEILVHNCDGSHITAMLIGWFKRFAPDLFEQGKICKLLTPLIILEDSHGKLVKYFMSLQEFKDWEKLNPNNKYKIFYQKGLGSWEKHHLQALIDNYGLENFILEYKLSEQGNIYIEDWLGTKADKRKQYLREFTLDINNV